MSNHNNQSKIIERDLYKKIIASMPIPCVEAIVSNSNGILLMKRNNSPAKGMWWFPGGHIQKGESLDEALHREVKEETNLEIRIERLIGVYNRIFEERHDVTLVFLCSTRDSEVCINDEHSAFKFFKCLPSNLHPYLYDTIRDYRSLKREHNDQ